jgi:hypothetical protein
VVFRRHSGMRRKAQTRNLELLDSGFASRPGMTISGTGFLT